MASELDLFYLGGMIVLFFFWAYGIVSFLLDLKDKFTPKDKQYFREWRRLEEGKYHEEERKEREEQLY